ncbi:Mitochondrial amidoxime-reducing component 1 [Halotydeus destructor]|nr:Mitochondrial amidoxime-reducing component 1 [Halotydeus destructor]
MAAGQSNTGLIFGLGVILASLVFVVTFKKRKVYQSNVGRVSKLIIYPVKSMPGIEVDKVEMTSSGAKYGEWRDRSFIVINKEMRMVTLRNQPRLALAKLSIDGNDLIMESAGFGSARVQLKTQISPEDEVVSFRMWGKDTRAVATGEEASKWLSNLVGTDGLRLVQFLPSMEMRPSYYFDVADGIKPDYSQMILFQDVSAFLVISEASITDFNSKLQAGQKPTDHRTWRPNVVVDNCAPFSEDRWNYLRTDLIELKATNLCPRCAVTAVDPDSGVKDSSKLSEYKKIRSPRTADQKRLYGDSPLFGMLFSLRQGGILTVGDQVDGVVSETDRI